MKKKKRYRDHDEPTNEGFIGKLFSSTAERLPAHVTEEQDWYMDTPDVRLARVFTIVLVLHVVAVGGILAFKMIDKASAPGPGLQVAAVDIHAPAGSLPAPAITAENDRNTPVTPAAPDPLIMQDPTRAGIEQYLVSRGDSLQSIATDLKVDVRDLQRLNSIHVGNQLYPGQWIAIPKRGEVTPRRSPSPTAIAAVERPASAPAPTTVLMRSSTYVVQPGDTPYAIARRFGMSSSDLMAANGINKAENMPVGKTLKIPER
jgi:LysM repeat protein